MYDEMYHHGVKGMRWGVRRKDSSGDGSSDTSRKKMTTGEVRAIKKSVDSTKQVVEEGRKVNKDISSKKVKKQVSKEAMNMSDQELREKVNRLNMEQQYKNLMESRTVDSGHARVERMLSNAGTVLTVGSTALSIALAIKELKG